jgi:hypothetical protein
MARARRKITTIAAGFMVKSIIEQRMHTAVFELEMLEIQNRSDADK